MGECLAVKVKSYIEEHQMLVQNDRVVAGISGGADSMCLLSILLELKEGYQLDIAVVHINHKLRGKEADDDEDHVKRFCLVKRLDFFPISVDIKKMAENLSIGEEEAGRQARYHAFEQICDSWKGTKIAVAHNQNDNAETILFHLFRGSALEGLTGIPPCRSQIIRPLLCISRKEIESYLNKNGICYRTDSTNSVDLYSRNKIRRHIIPYAEQKINCNAVEHIVSAAAELQKIALYMEKQTEQMETAYIEIKPDEISIPVDKLSALDLVIQQRLIRRMISNLCGSLRDIQSKHIEGILVLIKKQVGKQVCLPYGLLAKRNYTSLVITKKVQEIKKHSMFLVCNGFPWEYYLDNGLHFTLNIIERDKILYKEILNEKKQINENCIEIRKNCCTKWFDYDKIRNAVVLRTRKTGDYLRIGQDNGTKSLKSILIDQKTPREERDSIPLLADGDHIMWILGGRTSEGYLVDENTKRILVAELTYCDS